MTPHTSQQSQRGAVLVVGLIVLMLITLMVTAAFKFSTYNLKAVGNMQAHNEAIAAANKAIEQVIGSWDFRSAPSVDEISVDIDNNGTFDYTVAIEAPRCVKAISARVAGSKGDDCIDKTDGKQVCNSGLAAATMFNVVWDVPATATSNNGTSVRVRQGVSLSMTKSQCTAACPPAPGQPCV
jgi:Tfp pilus assembly protein PilX